ncbi:MAG: glycosyltransferase family 39 protein [Verrucomicrobia bacterium]|nr:glycosyltransferase family 39 protein [Verrucomicrobiota bacterium]
MKNLFSIKKGWVMWALLVYVVLAGVLRGLYLQELAQGPELNHPVLDAGFHDYWARALITGDWTPPSGEGDPHIQRAPYLRPPGYVFFLNTVYRVLGQSYLTPRVVQMFLGIVNVLLVFFLGRRVFDEVSGLIAAALMSVYWIFIYFEGELLAPVLLVMFTLLILLALERWVNRPSFRMAFLAGLVCGLFAITRPNILLFLPVLVVWFLWVLHRRSEVRRLPLTVAGLVLGVAVCVAPVTIRNYRATGEFVLVSCNGEVNLYIGNNPQSDGVTSIIPELKEVTGMSGWDWFDYPQIVEGLAQHLGRPVSYTDAADYFAAKAWAFIRENPRRFIELTIIKARLFWGPWEVPNNKVVEYERANSRILRYLPGYSLALSLAIVGLLVLYGGFDKKESLSTTLRARRTEILVLLHLFVAVYFISFLPFLVAARFRAPLIPILLLVGGYGVKSVSDWVRRREMKAVLMGVVLWACVFSIIKSKEAVDPNLGRWHYEEGRAYFFNRNYHRARVEAEKALEVDPDYWDASLLLIDCHTIATNLPAAESACLTALDRDASFLPARKKLVDLLTRQGKLTEAMDQYRYLLGVKPDWPEMLNNLSRALATHPDVSRRNPQESIALAEKARDLTKGQEPIILDTLASAYLSAGRNEDAVKTARLAIELARSQGKEAFAEEVRARYLD